MKFDDYREKARAFRHMVEIGQEYDDPLDALHGHFNVADEEWREMCECELNIESVLVGDADDFGDVPQQEMVEMAEEMADVVVTMHIMADMLGIDLKAAYEKKMEYNLSKSATKDENNKVTDDADIDKPQFHDTVGGVQ